MVERLISIFFFRETQAGSDEESPLAGKPCGLIGVAEYSNPHQILEYLHDFCTVLKMRPVVLERFPYLGVAGQGNIDDDETFHPFGRCKDLAGALVEEVQRKKSTLVLEVRTATVQHVEVTEDSLVVDLADGRTTSVPLAWYPRLLHAVPEERGNWRLIGEGEGIHWPDLDEDVSVENILFGRPSQESQESFRRWLEARPE